MVDERLENVEALQNMLVERATGGAANEAEYARLRRLLLDDPEITPLLPRFVRTCRTASQFWQFIKHEFGTYFERRQYLWEEFRPALDHLEGKGKTPADDGVSEALKQFDEETVHALWARALGRRAQDPEGAITLARSLLSTALDQADPDPENVSALLDSIPGAYESAGEGRRALHAGHVVRLEDL